MAVPFNITHLHLHPCIRLICLYRLLFTETRLTFALSLNDLTSTIYAYYVRCSCVLVLVPLCVRRTINWSLVLFADIYFVFFFHVCKRALCVNSFSVWLKFFFLAFFFFSFFQLFACLQVFFMDTVYIVKPKIKTNFEKEKRKFYLRKGYSYWQYLPFNSS